jgi:hypothetical protein
MLGPVQAARCHAPHEPHRIRQPAFCMRLWGPADVEALQREAGMSELLRLPSGGHCAGVQERRALQAAVGPLCRAVASGAGAAGRGCSAGAPLQPAPARR